MQKAKTRSFLGKLLRGSAVLAMAALVLPALPVLKAQAVYEKYGYCGGGESGLNAMWFYKDGTLIIAGAGLMDDYNDLNYNAHRPGWYEFRDEITTVEIDDGIMNIGNHAFADCSNLTSVTIADSVTEISEYAFFDDAKLKTITLPAGVTEIGRAAFGYTGLTSVDIPAGVTEIHGQVFTWCPNLTTVTIPAGVTSIEAYAFYNCEKLAFVELKGAVPPAMGDYPFDETPDYLTILVPENSVNTYRAASGWNNYYGQILQSSPHGFCGKNVRWIVKNGTLTLSGTGKMYSYGEFSLIPWYDLQPTLTGIEIQEGVESISAYSFRRSPEVTEITIPSTVKSIGNYAFEKTGLCSVSIPEGVTSIARGTFYGCKNLTSVSIPESVVSIKEEAFYQCTALNAVSIPQSVTEISDFAFFGCTNLAGIYVQPDNPAYCSVAGVLFSKDGSTLYNYPAGKPGTAYTIPSEVKSIEDGAFSYSGLTSVTIPSGVTSIGSSAFSNTGLTSVTIPSSVTFAGPNAFRECRNLATVIMESDRPLHLILNLFLNCSDDLIIYVPKESVDAYKTAWSNYADRIHSSIIQLKPENVTLTKTTFAYTGSAVKVGSYLTVKYNGEPLTYGTDFTTSYANNKNIGYQTASATVNGKGDYTGSVTLYYSILPAKQAKPALSMDGTALHVAWTADPNAQGYQVQYCKNSSFIGATLHTASYGKTVTSCTLSKYPKLGETWYVRVRSYITDGSGTKRGFWSDTASRKLTAAITSVTLSKTQFAYTGSAVKVGSYLTVKCGDTKLTYGTDYTTSYSANTAVGYQTAAVTVKGTGEYSGSVTLHYSILPPKQAKPTLSMDGTALHVAWTVDASAVGYELEYCKNSSFSPTDESYHCVTYTGKTAVNLSKYPKLGETWYVRVRAFITNNGSTSGTKYGAWSDAASRKLTAAITSVTLSKTEFNYTGSAITVGSYLTVKCGETKLNYGTDYTTTYTANKNCGVKTAKVTVKGIGNYSGTFTKTFTIVPAKQAKPTLTAVSGGFKAEWTADSNAIGYELVYCKNSSFTGDSLHSFVYTTTSATLTKYPATGEKWYVKVRAVISSNGTTSGTLYGTYSAVASVTAG